jgi:hypothetical protein
MCIAMCFVFLLTVVFSSAVDTSSTNEEFDSDKNECEVLCPQSRKVIFNLDPKLTGMMSTYICILPGNNCYLFQIIPIWISLACWYDIS